MMILYKGLLGLHIVAGFLSLVCGLMAVASKKGMTLHKSAGKMFYYSMLAVGISAVILAGYKSNLFLFCIGVFSFYQNYAGFRAVKNKSLVFSKSDSAILVISSLNSIVMLFSFNAILFAFGLISASTCFSHWKVFFQLRRNTLAEKAWLKLHIGMMMGAFIATLTAFLVVNMQLISFISLPPAVVWFTPTVLFVPVLVYYSRKYVPEGVRAK